MTDMNNMVMGMGIAVRARAEADMADQRAHQAEMRALEAEANVPKGSTDRDLKRKVAEFASAKNIAESVVESQRREIEAMDALILEWMHSNEAFKRLALKYGKQVGRSEEEQAAERVELIIDISEEDPKFSNTKLTAKARAKMGST